jgi:hypothetical protein
MKGSAGKKAVLEAGTEGRLKVALNVGNVGLQGHPKLQLIVLQLDEIHSRYESEDDNEGNEEEGPGPVKGDGATKGRKTS